MVCEKEIFKMVKNSGRPDLVCTKYCHSICSSIVDVTSGTCSRRRTCMSSQTLTSCHMDTMRFLHQIAIHVLLDVSLTVKAAPHECVIRTSQS